MNDKEYLSRPLVSTVTYINTPTKIQVSNENTSYFNLVLNPRLNQADLLSEYSKIIKLCRELKIKIKYTRKYKQFILENWETYLKEKKAEILLFKELGEKIAELEKRGIHMGNSDDIFLQSCFDISNKIQEYRWRTSVISKINTISNDISNFLEELHMQKETDKYGKFTFIYL